MTRKAFDPEFTPSKVLGSNAPPTAAAQAITRWIAKLRLKDALKAQLQQSCKVAAATLKPCREEEIHILHQRAVDFGFPVRHLKEAKNCEILKIVLAACALASRLDDPELGCGNDVRAELSSLFLLCQTCLEAAIHDPSFVECRLGVRVFCAFVLFSFQFRQTGTGKQGRWRQRFAQFRNNKPPSIFEVQEWLAAPFFAFTKGKIPESGSFDSYF